MKPCKVCGIEKSLDEFHRCKKMKDGHLNSCKICRNKANKEYEKTNKIKIRLSKKIYREKNADKIAIYKNKYNRDNVLKRSEYAKKNSDRISLYRKTDKYKSLQKNRRRKCINQYKSQTIFTNSGKGVYPEFCEKCKEESKTEAHHHDYNLPFDVTYLCKRCHCDWHLENTPLHKEFGIFTEAKK